MEEEREAVAKGVVRIEKGVVWEEMTREEEDVCVVGWEVVTVNMAVWEEMESGVDSVGIGVDDVEVVLVYWTPLDTAEEIVLLLCTPNPVPVPDNTELEEVLLEVFLWKVQLPDFALEWWNPDPVWKEEAVNETLLVEEVDVPLIVGDVLVLFPTEIELVGAVVLVGDEREDVVLNVAVDEIVLEL